MGSDFDRKMADLHERKMEDLVERITKADIHAPYYWRDELLKSLTELEELVKVLDKDYKGIIASSRKVLGLTPLSTKASPVKDQKKKVFISYNHQDGEIAQRIFDRLKKEGFDIFKDALTLQIGDNLEKSLKAALRETDFVISIFSSNSLISEWVGLETTETLLVERFGKKDQNIFLPVLLDKEVVGEENVIRSIHLLDQNIAETEKRIRSRFGLKVPLNDLIAKYNRLIDLRNNLTNIVSRVKEHIAAVLDEDSDFDLVIDKLIERIRL